MNITIEEIWDLYIKQDKKCSISNISISIEDASLDRIDNAKGYFIGNV